MASVSVRVCAHGYVYTYWHSTFVMSFSDKIATIKWLQWNFGNDRMDGYDQQMNSIENVPNVECHWRPHTKREPEKTCFYFRFFLFSQKKLHTKLRLILFHNCCALESSIVQLIRYLDICRIDSYQNHAQEKTKFKTERHHRYDEM